MGQKKNKIRGRKSTFNIRIKSIFVTPPWPEVIKIKSIAERFYGNDWNRDDTQYTESVQRSPQRIH